MRIIFMGTSEFAIPSLEAITESDFELVGVFTQPDRPRGRGQKFQPTPIKITAEKHDLPIFQPKKVRSKSWVKKIRELEPTAIIVVAFGQILPKSILEIPPRGCLNVHPSLLPKYRGAAPIQWALINGETETGITIMSLDEGEDTGGLILQKLIAIENSDNAQTLHDRLSKIAPPMLIDAIKTDPPHTPQDGSKATHAPKLTKEIAKIDWQKSATEIRNLVRGVSVWPKASAIFRNEISVKIIECSAIETETDLPPASVKIENGDLFIATAKGLLQIEKIQPATKQIMIAKDFVNGYRVKTGDRFRIKTANKRQ